MNRHTLFTFLGRIFILLALVLAACAPPPPPALSQPLVKPQNFDFVCVGSADANRVLETTPYYIKGQVILTGPADRIGGLVDSLAQKGFPLTPIYLCTLGIPDRLPYPNQEGQSSGKDSKRNSSQATFPFSGPNVPGSQLTMNLYKFDDSRFTLFQLFEQLNALQNGLQKQEKIYADANYLTGQLGNTACGNPFGVEGSPFGVEGSPFGVEGSPYGGMSKDANAAGFWSQWAFQKIGLVQSNERPFKETGNGMRVAVFDTTPNTSPYPQKAGSPPTPVTQNAVTPALNLTVHFPYDLPKLKKTAPANPSPNVRPNVSDHGVFASSLVHAVAYMSDIDLYKVLDESGCGDLYVLDRSILNFLSTQWNAEAVKLKQPAVINLSLGIRRPADLPSDPKALNLAKADIQKLSEELQSIYNGLQKDDRSLESIGTVLQFANGAGMVIVAAAGNDSVPGSPQSPNMPLPMDLPAAYNFVIGISATTPTDGPACYSNMGDVGAPGGDAAPDVDPSSSTPICKSLAVDCPTKFPPGQCPYGVMGLSTIATSTGFAYWSGTSFAAPLASGLAALLLEHQGAGRPDLVMREMVSHVNPMGDNRFGAGVISVIEALK